MDKTNKKFRLLEQLCEKDGCVVGKPVVYDLISSTLNLVYHRSIRDYWLWLQSKGYIVSVPRNNGCFRIVIGNPAYDEAIKYQQEKYDKTSFA